MSLLFLQECTINSHSIFCFLSPCCSYPDNINKISMLLLGCSFWKKKKLESSNIMYLYVSSSQVLMVPISYLFFSVKVFHSSCLLPILSPVIQKCNCSTEKHNASLQFYVIQANNCDRNWKNKTLWSHITQFQSFF